MGEAVEMDKATSHRLAVVLIFQSIQVCTTAGLWLVALCAWGQRFECTEMKGTNLKEQLNYELYSILEPHLVGLTVAVRNIAGRCFSAVCSGLNHRRYSILNYTIPISEAIGLIVAEKGY